MEKRATMHEIGAGERKPAELEGRRGGYELDSNLLYELGRNSQTGGTVSKVSKTRIYEIRVGEREFL